MLRLFVARRWTCTVLYCTACCQALDLYWHEDCLKCGCCDARLGEVGHSLYTKGNLLLCKRDYLRWEQITLYVNHLLKMFYWADCSGPRATALRVTR